MKYEEQKASYCRRTFAIRSDAYLLYVVCTSEVTFGLRIHTNSMTHHVPHVPRSISCSSNVERLQSLEYLKNHASRFPTRPGLAEA